MSKMFADARELMSTDNSFEIAVRIHAAMQLPGIGARTVQKALDTGVNCFDSDAFVDSLLDVSSRVSKDSISACDLDGLIGVSWDLLETATNDGQELITYLDAGYPNSLRDLSNPPLILFCRGNTSLLHSNMPYVAAVGSRKAGDYGLRVAHRFGEVLTEAGAIVVSGLAIGCDTAAHEGCLEKDGATIAVLPSPLNKVVPEQNAQLADRIISKHGLLIGELPPGARIDRSTFVQRNRIQAALSEKVIIIETSVNGGTMRTAEFAQKLQRMIGAYSFPKEYQTRENEGNSKLINERLAIPLSDAQSISTFLNTRPQSVEEQLLLPL